MLLGITRISLEVFRGHHDHEPNGTLVSEHLIGPPADGAHALHGSDAVVGNENLREMRTWGIRLGPLLAAAAQGWGPAPREGSAGGEQSRAEQLVVSATKRLHNSSFDAQHCGSKGQGLWPSFVPAMQSFCKQSSCNSSVWRVSLFWPTSMGDTGDKQLWVAPDCHQFEPGRHRRHEQCSRMLL